ncbi:MAG: hypothetical protein ACREJO_15825, partial [Phycisphaerales bacterium]
GIAIPLLIIGAYIVIPPIASSMAPGKIEAAAAEAIKGKVRVSDVSIGWGGPTKVGKIEILDDTGKTVGTLSVTSSLGIWAAIGGLNELGTTTISGKIDLVRTNDAQGNSSTNLERAIAPRTPSSSGGATKLPRIAATLKIEKLDVSYTELDTQGQTVTTAAMNGATGTASINTLAGAEPALSADIKAAFAGGGAATPGDLRIKTNASKFIDGSGALTPTTAVVDADILATGVPVALVDALANQKGLLAGALGDRADATISAKGNGSAGSATIRLTAPNAAADLSLALAGGKLMADKPGAVSLKSTAFALKQPAVREALAKSGLDISQAPSLDAKINTLSWPTGSDLRGAMVDVQVSLSEIRGTAKLADQPVRNLIVAPAELSIKSTDLAKDATAMAQTSATLDGQSAGTVAVNLHATDLLDAKGALRSFAAAGVDGSAEVRGLSAELLAPFVAAAKLPINVRDDIGPTVDISLRAQPAAGAAGRTVEFTLESRNIHAQAPVKFTNSAVSSDKFSLRIDQGVNLARRFVEQPAGSAKLAGIGAVAMDGSFSVPLKDGQANLEASSITASALISNIQTQIGSEPPVQLAQVNARAAAAPGQPLKITLDTTAQQGTQQAKVNGDVAVSGLFGGAKSAELPSIGAIRIKGTVAADDIPGPMVESLGRAFGALNEASQVGAVVRELLGASTDINLVLTPESDGRQSVVLDIKGAGVQASTALAIAPSQLQFAALDAKVNATASLATSLLNAAGLPEQARTLRLTAPANVTLKLGAPFALPLSKDAAGKYTLAPDLAAAEQPVKLKATVDQIDIAGLQADQPSARFGIRDLTADVDLVLADLADAPVKGARTGGLTAKLEAKATRDGQPAGTIAGGVSAAVAAGNMSASLVLSDLPTPLVDTLAGRPGLVSGLAGDRLTVSFSGGQAGKGQPMTATLGVTSPTLKVSGVQIESNEASIRLAKPVSIEATAQPAWIEQFVLGTKTGETPSMRIGQPVPVQIAVRSLTLSRSRTVNNATVGGPFKPGVFNVDADVTIPSLALVRQQSGAGGRSVTATTNMQGLTGKVSTPSAGVLSADVQVAKVYEDSAATGDPVTMKASLKNFADGEGAANFDAATKDLSLNANKFPTAIIGAFVGPQLNLVKTLGPEIRANIAVTNFSPTTGSVNARLQSNKATFNLVGNVQDGALVVQSNQPLELKLSEFSYGVDSKLLQVLPLFAEASKLSDGKFSTITSNNLRLPIDGDMRKLNGDIRVDIGKIEYVFDRSFGQFLDATVFSGGKAADQRPIEPFNIAIRNGVATYDKFEIPVRNVGIKSKGSVNLVNDTIDVVTYIPTIAAAPGLMGNINNQLSKGFGKIFPNIIAEGTMIPVRTRGPMDKPTREVDVALMAEEFGNQLNPVNILGNLPNLFNKDKNKPAPAPAPAPAPGSTPPKKP